MSKLIKFKQGIYQNPTKFLVNGQDADIKPNFGTVVQEGTPYTSTIFNEITRQITYTVKDTSTGANTFVAALEGLEATDITNNLKVMLEPNTTNTGSSTINLQGLGIKPIKKQGNINLTKGDIVKGQYALLNYSETYNCFELINPDCKVEIVNDLTSGGVDKALSAEQGKVLFQSVSDGKTLVAGAITDKGITTSPSDTFQKMATNISLIETKSILTGNATVDKVLQGSTFYKDNADVKLTGEMPNNGTISNTITTQGGQFNIPKGYTEGGSVKAQFANLQPGNIKQGINVGGVVGTFSDLILLPKPISANKSQSIATNDYAIIKIPITQTPKIVTVHGEGQYGNTTMNSAFLYNIQGGEKLMYQNTTPSTWFLDINQTEIVVTCRTNHAPSYPVNRAEVWVAIFY